jgi:hypothetical protein
MATTILDTHAFIKRLTAAGLPEAQAEILADQQSRVLGDQLATKQDIALLRGDLDSLRSDMTAMEQRIKDQLTIRPGSMLAAAVVLVGALVALF